MSESSLPVYPFRVALGATHIGFTEVTGLTHDRPGDGSRDGSPVDFASVKLPGLRKFTNIVLKRGVATGDADFLAWLDSVRSGTAERRDLTITLLDEKRVPLRAWTVRGARPVKFVGPELHASGNEVAIESIELAHEGLEVHDDGS